MSAGSPGRRLAGTSNVPTWSYVAAAGAASTANAAAASNPVPKRKANLRVVVEVASLWGARAAVVKAL